MFLCKLCDRKKSDDQSRNLYLSSDDILFVCIVCHGIVSRYRYEAAKAAGSRVTEKKARSSVENGKLGGRPKKVLRGTL